MTTERPVAPLPVVAAHRRLLARAWTLPGAPARRARTRRARAPGSNRGGLSPRPHGQPLRVLGGRGLAPALVSLQNRTCAFRCIRLLSDVVLVTHTYDAFEVRDPSSFVFSSWQCRCKASRFDMSHVPPRDSGMMWSASMWSVSWNRSPHLAHRPSCLLSSGAIRVEARG